MSEEHPTEADVIKGARDILADPKHWRKGGFTDGGGRYCALGALGMAACNDAQAYTYGYEAVMLSAMLLANQLHLSPEISIAAFNDDPGTTHEDVLNLMDKALAELGALA